MPERNTNERIHIMGKGLRVVLSEAQAKGSAIGHFNISDIAMLKAVIAAGRDMKTVVIIGVSEGERTYLGTRQIAAVIRSLRDEINVPIFLNADHTHSPRARLRQRTLASIRLCSTTRRCLLRTT